MLFSTNEKGVIRMERYVNPGIYRLDYVDFLFVKTQATGFPTNVNCSFLTCNQFLATDDATFDINWQDPDNDGTDVAGYRVNITINGEPFNNLQDSLPNCAVTFAAGIFTLDCNNLPLGASTCSSNPDTLVVVSIQDPDGNVLSPTGESCNFLVTPS